MDFERILAKETIFTDCFDTLLIRKCSAKEVIFEFCKLLGDKWDIEPAFLYSNFVHIKNKLAREKYFATSEAEYGFMEADGLAERFAKAICGEDQVKCLKFKSDCHDLYIEAETQNLTVNSDLVGALRKLKERGSKIYVVSDFYCEKEMIAKILDHFSILDIFEDLFISCDNHSPKRTKALYKKVLKILSIDPSHVVMIGDNKKSDFCNAKKCKIQAVKLEVKHAKSAKNFKERTKFGYNYDKFLQIQKDCEEYNFSNFAFPLYLFIKRLHSELEEREARDVFFLAREGGFLKKLFEIYSSTLKEREKLRPVAESKRGGGKTSLPFDIAKFGFACKFETFGRGKF